MLTPATAGDWPAIAELLSAAGLPLEGAREHMALVARDADGLVGAIGLEVYGEHGLLRSTAVRADVRTRGSGAELVRGLIELARERGLRSLTLLTTTAAAYFPRFGFVVVERAAVPAEVQQSVEFRGACPASATVMMLML
jgi:amino-acid N-acetyltransferase